MTNNEKIINIAGLTYTLRDLLEDSEFDREFKMRVKNFTAYLDKKVKLIAGDDPDVWKELDDLQQHFHENFVRESLEKSE